MSGIGHLSNLIFYDQVDIFADPAILPSPHPANLNILISVMENFLAILVKMARRICIARAHWLENAIRPGTMGRSGAVKATALTNSVNGEWNARMEKLSPLGQYK